MNSTGSIHSSRVGPIHNRPEATPAAAPDAGSGTVAIDAEALHDLTREVSDLTNVVDNLARRIVELKALVVAMHPHALGPATAKGPEAEAPMWENGMLVSSAEKGAELKEAFTANGGMGRGLAFVNTGA